MEFSNFIVYADESGDHGLKSIDPNYPIFVLTLCIFEKSDYTGLISPAVQRFKFKYFGHDSVVLHEHDIRKQKRPFVYLKSESKRELFMDDLTDIVDSAPFTIVAAVINKEALVKQYVDPGNPYEIALLFAWSARMRFSAIKEQRIV